MTISLSDHQLRMVLAAAAQVPAAWRNRFLESIADRLLSLQPPSNDEVAQAISHVANRLHVNVEVTQ